MTGLLEYYNCFSALTLAASLLAVLGLCIATGSSYQQVELIRELRSSVERASWNCMHARSKALTQQFDAQGNVGSPFGLDQSGRHFVSESDRLIRTLAAIIKHSGDMRVSNLRRRLKDLRRVEKESLRLLSTLESGRDCGQDSFSGHSQNMTVAASATAERKTFGHQS